MTRPTLPTATAAALATVLVAGLLALTPASARPAPPRPDLTVTSATTQAQVRQGGTLSVVTVVRNAGRAAARRSTTRFVLSRDARPGSDRALRPLRAVPLLRPGRVHRSTTRLVVPAGTPVGAWYVLACADVARKVRESRERNNCRATRRVIVTLLPSSQELIEADVAAGRLTEEQGLVYRVFADFGDRRLPARYAGRPNGLGEGALGEVADSWESLAPATQSVVRPFLVPPFYAGSHWSPAGSAGTAGAAGTASQRAAFDSPWCSGGTDVQPLFETWDHLDTTGGDVRIWWLRKNTADAAKAAHYADILENKVLPALVTLMGRGPKGDGGGVCDGGTDGLDIALVDASTATAFNDSSCGASGSSAHILFPRDAAKPGWAGADPYLAHEVMHAIQYASPMAGGCRRYHWLMEMTAQWVQDFVTDPAYGIGLGPDDTEHQAAPIYLDNPGVSFEVESPPVHHDYSDYLLALWAARRSSPAFVKDIWDAAARLGPKEAVDAALPGGFEATWADFALSNWNRDPVRDYRDWDGLSAGAAVDGTIPVGPVKTQTASIPVNHLAAQYAEVTLDPKIEELEITNDLAGHAGAGMRAVLTYSDGSHRVVDLSDRPSTVLCIDDGTKKVTRLVLVMSNADLNADLTFQPTFVPSQVCGCPNATPLGVRSDAVGPGPVCSGQGNISFTYTEDVTDEGEITHETQTTGSGSLNLVLDPAGSRDGGWFNGPGSTYAVESVRRGQVRRGAQGGCGDEDSIATERGSGPIPPDSVLTYPDWQDEATLLLSRLAHLPTRVVFDNDVTCIGHQHDEWDSVQTLPTCAPVAPGTSSRDWEFEQTAPGSDVFVLECSGTVTFVDGGDRTHTVTVSASGTIRLPEDDD